MATKDDRGKPKQPARRRVQVDGEPQAQESSKKVTTRSLQEILGDPSKGNEEGEKPEGPVWDPVRLEQFLRGQITLGDLEGITKHEQYEMAKIGFSHLTSGKLAQAKTVFEGLIALDPFDAYFHTALGSIAQQENNLEEAEKRYSRALEINPFSPVALANRGEVRVMSGRLAEGAQDLLKALEEDPNAVQPSTQRARATIAVVREQLQALDLPPLPEGAAKTTGSRVPTLPKTPVAQSAQRTQSKPGGLQPSEGEQSQGAAQSARPAHSQGAQGSQGAAQSSRPAQSQGAQGSQGARPGQSAQSQGAAQSSRPAQGAQGAQQSHGTQQSRAAQGVQTARPAQSQGSQSQGSQSQGSQSQGSQSQGSQSQGAQSQGAQSQARPSSAQPARSPTPQPGQGQSQGEAATAKPSTAQPRAGLPGGRPRASRPSGSAPRGATPPKKK